jgi:NodT family efflux transporter outer membrane factor (OMF) lipoprotein
LALALAATSAALAGCMVGPDYHRPDMATQPAFGEAASTRRTTVSAADADLSTWWTQFGDAKLNDLIVRALADNPDLQIAASRVRQAREQVKIANAALFPTLNATGNALAYNSDRNGSNAATGGAGSGLAGLPIPSHLSLYSAGFDSTWELDLFGGVRRGIEAAHADAEAAEWDRRDGQVSLLAEVANSYLTLRAVQARLAVGQAELQRQRDLLGLVRDRRRQGFTTALDVNQQQTQVSLAAAQLPQLAAEAAVQIHALGVLLGQPPEALIQELAAAAPSANPALPPPPPTLPTGLPSELLQRRPDVREAERRLAAANAEIGVQTADLYPKVNLIGLASFAGPKLNGLLDNQNFSSLGVGMITAPVFNAGRTAASIASAREEREQALITYRETVLSALREVEDALARFKTEDDRRANLVQSVNAAHNTLTIAEDQYNAGVVSFINVLQAENALLNSRDQLIQSDAQTLSDLVAVYKALGGGWRGA